VFEIGDLKKRVTPEAKREDVRHIVSVFRRSIRKACSLIGIHRRVFKYTPKVREDEPLIRARLRTYASEFRRWGCIHFHDKLREEGWLINHKRTERLYALEKLQIRKRRRIKRSSASRVPPPKATHINHVWAMDFIFDALTNGRKLKTFPIMDTFTRESLRIEVDTSISAQRVVRVLNELANQRGLPEYITLDNGPEFRSRALDAWACERGVKLHFITPGKPTENPFIESFNDKFRNECLNDNSFFTLDHARGIIEDWRILFNTKRRHSSLGRMTPEAFCRMEQEKQLTMATKL
jgi:putative transposase